MSRLSFRPPALSLAVAVGALALAACSDSPLSPVRSLASGDASFSATLSGNSFIIASDATAPNPTQFCSGSTQLGVFDEAHAFPVAPPALTGCAPARDLQADLSLAAYNPGWDNPIGLTTTTGHWVGFTAGTGPSSDYRPTPGLYYYSQSFTLPTGVTSPSLTLQVMADNIAAVYLNGTKLGSQYFADCNNVINQPPVQNCNWTNTTGGGLLGGRLTVTAAAGLFSAPGVVNTLEFIVADVPTGYPSAASGVGGSPTNYGCTTRQFQQFGQAGFGGAPVATASGHVGPHPTGEAAGILPLPALNTANPGQDGCENPSGLDFAGTATWTPPALKQWCSPGFWKTHLDAWSVANQNKLYSTLVGAAPLSKKAPTTGPGSNPTLKDVISDPSTYGGPATNSVADYLSGLAFGSNVGNSSDDSRCNNGVPLTPPS